MQFLKVRILCLHPDVKCCLEMGSYMGIVLYTVYILQLFIVSCVGILIDGLLLC